MTCRRRRIRAMTSAVLRTSGWSASAPVTVSAHRRGAPPAALNRTGLSAEVLDVKNNSRSPQLPHDVDVTNIEYRFQCGHEECGSQITASTRDDLMLLIAQHLKDAHSIYTVTNTLLSYLESTCVTVWFP